MLTIINKCNKRYGLFRKLFIQENITPYEHNTITNQLKDLTFEYQKYCKDCEVFIK